ncbi:initiation control protein YabA [Secundilactobacillus kimchicus]|uniref:initiation control protein YabA n=1 Tax=Secundilactobacillus kimchicus TaxID=528209 RepID=UPI003F7354AA
MTLRPSEKNLITCKKTVTAKLEENAELTIENQHLRELLAEDEGGGQSTQLSKSRQTLEKLYEQGYHVCNRDYGTRLDKGESCAFCLDVIYGER